MVNSNEVSRGAGTATHFSRAIQLLGLAFLAFSLSSCGFHLRGNIPLPESIQNLHVKAPEGTFKNTLEDVLGNAGAEIAPTAAAADALLVVRSANSKRDVGTLDETGLANSYDLTFTVRYVLEDADGEVLRQVSTVRERRRFDFDPALVVETESEEMELQEDMEREVALKIVRQLSRFQPEVEAGEEGADEQPAASE